MKYRQEGRLKILICHRCGKDLENVINIFTQKYCADCRAIVTREGAAERQRKMRAKRKESHAENI